MAASAGKRETHPPDLLVAGGTPEGMTDYNQEMRSNMWKGQRDGNPDIEEELAKAEEEGDKAQAQAEAGDADFNPEKPESGAPEAGNEEVTE